MNRSNRNNDKSTWTDRSSSVSEDSMNERQQQQKQLNTSSTTTELDDIVIGTFGDSHDHNDANIVEVEPRRKDGKSATKAVAAPKRIPNQQRWMTVITGFILLVCVIFAMYFYIHSKHSKNVASTAKSVNSNDDTTRINGTSKSVTMEELQLHNDGSTDCWLSIRNKVYDVTEWIPIHPGGSATIAPHCGTDATKSFIQQHRTTAYLSRHSPPVVLIGALANDISNNSTSSTSSSTNSDSENESEEEQEVEDEGEDTMDDSNASSATTTPTTVPTMEPTIFSTPCISLDEVMLHNTESDCYYILYDYVFDFTNYIYEHPGGPKYVLNECGTDATIVYSNEKAHTEDLLWEVNAYDLYGLGYAC